MPNKRRQFHSCEACQKSRLGCDARQRDRGEACFNCARQGKECIVKWKKVPLKGTSKNTSSLPEAPTIPLSQPTQLANRRQEGEALHGALLKTFSIIFESRFSHILQSYSCPVFPLGAPTEGSIISLALSLDNQSSMKKRKLSPSSPPGNLSRISALTAAVRAFAFKFFITGTGSTQTSNGAKSQSQACHNSIWTEAIPLAKQAMKDRSYQSILTLYIIGLASLSINTPDKPQGFEAECFDSASRHIKVLRELERTDQDEDRRHQSEIAYWCVALTENACQLNQLQRLGETSLFSEKSQVWGVVRERTSLFHQSFKSLHGMREPMSKEVISAILQHATLHKCMTWWNMNNIKSYTEGDLDELLQTAARDMLTFRDVFTPLLDLVGRDFLMLNPKDQLSYVLVTVHFYWAVLLFIEEIDKRSPDPPVRHMISKSEASRSIVNTLSQAQLVYETSAYQPSVLLIDPMPETMVSCIVSAASALLELFGNGTFSLGACRTMLSVLVASLKVLCQISPNAKYALEKLNVETMQKSIFKSELASSSDMCKNGTQKLIS